MNKKIYFIYTILLMLVINIIPAIAQTAPAIYMDGVLIEPADALPFIDENGRTQIPVRMFGEAAGAKVSWAEDRQRVTITGDVNCTVIDIGSTTMYLNGKKIKMDTEACIINDRTYVPARFVGEGMNYTVTAADDLSAIYFTKNADDPTFIKDDDNDEWPDFLARILNADKYPCKYEVYTGDLITNEVKEYFGDKEASEIHKFREFESNEEHPIYNVGKTIYQERIVLKENEKIEPSSIYSGCTLQNLSEDMIIEYIPDANNDEFEVCIIPYKQYLTKTAEESQVRLGEIWINSTERTIIKVSDIYHDNIIAPTFGVDRESTFYIYYFPNFKNQEGKACSGTIRIASAGEPMMDSE